jgi:hypothetical protein
MVARRNGCCLSGFPVCHVDHYWWDDQADIPRGKIDDVGYGRGVTIACLGYLDGCGVLSGTGCSVKHFVALRACEAVVPDIVFDDESYRKLGPWTRAG